MNNKEENNAKKQWRVLQNGKGQFDIPIIAQHTRHYLHTEQWNNNRRKLVIGEKVIFGIEIWMMQNKYAR